LKKVLPAFLSTTLLVTGLAVTCLFAATPALGWGTTGHMIVAQIAYEDLRPEVRAEADRLIALLAEDDPVADHFVPASYWMDRLRQSGWRAFDHWHYTNRPINGDGLGDVAGEDRHNVAWAIYQARLVLENDEVGDQQKAWMLRVLIHLVGDIHQPLHCVARFTRDQPRGDRGGNLFLLSGEIENLHFYWDSLAGRFPRVSPDGSWEPSIRSFAGEVRRALSPAELATAARDLDPETWVRESFDLANRAVYSDIEPGSAPSPAYEARAREESVRRLALAGVRLGGVLNQVLKSSASKD